MTLTNNKSVESRFLAAKNAAGGSPTVSVVVVEKAEGSARARRSSSHQRRRRPRQPVGRPHASARARVFRVAAACIRAFAGPRAQRRVARLRSSSCRSLSLPAPIPFATASNARAKLALSAFSRSLFTLAIADFCRILLRCLANFFILLSLLEYFYLFNNIFRLYFDFFSLQSICAFFASLLLFAFSVFRCASPLLCARKQGSAHVLKKNAIAFFLTESALRGGGGSGGF